MLCIQLKPVLSDHSKIDKTYILMTDGSLMKVESLQNAPLGVICNTFDLHKSTIGLERKKGGKDQETVQ